MDRAGSVSRRLAARVKALRAERHQTLKELSAASGLSLRLLALVESGEANPTLASMVELAAALGVDVGVLLAASSRPERECVVALVGLRGAGKSTVGRALAQALQWKFIELDRRIEAEAGLTLATLFELHGAAHVRGIEARVVSDVVASDDHVVLATGGGIVTAAETWSLLRARTLTVWLKATPQEHWDRVRAQGDERPMAKRSAARDELDALWAARAPLYAQAAITIDTSKGCVDDITAELVAQLHHSARPAGTSERGKAPGPVPTTQEP
jgi:XRE family aerobic/anaerobic benzoate catabolism transcriptional regulator